MKRLLGAMILPIVFGMFVVILPVMRAHSADTAERVAIISRAPQAGVRAPTMTANLGSNSSSIKKNTTPAVVKDAQEKKTETSTPATPPAEETGPATPETPATPVMPAAPTEPEIAEDCREVYRDCMDQFCLLDTSEGGRCVCSDNIYSSKDKITEINSIIASSKLLNTEGVERELAGTQADLIFGATASSEAAGRAKKNNIDYLAWLNSGNYLGDDSSELDYDDMFGDPLYKAAQKSCKSRLARCGSDAKMEEILYSRMITADCKSFNSTLETKKKFEEDNKALAEKNVRLARTKMLSTTNKYNRGECLIAYKSCIADKGGCGANFENCLDESLLSRRANACEDILDQCNAVRSYVKKDWEDEAKLVLADAAKYVDINRRGTCLAKIQACLEDSCSTASNSACLDNVNVAAGICPIITECEELIPGIKRATNDKLGFLRVRFCQNDVDKCLQEKCGADYTEPACIGKKPTDIINMCPQSMFPSCVGQKQFDIIVSAALLQMDYQMMQGCINYFSDQLGRVCGTDMSCLTPDMEVMNMKSSKDSVDWRGNADAAVDSFFKQFEKDQTVAACADSKKLVGRAKMGTTVFNTAKLLAKYQAEDRAFRAYSAKVAELSRKEDLASASENCDKLFKEMKKSNTGTRSKDAPGVWVTSHSFEPALRNCRIVKVQKVCETGGETKGTSALKAGAGGLTAGASAGTMVSPGWGTAIGGIIGAVGGAVGGAMAGGEKTFCQEIETVEDINM